MGKADDYDVPTRERIARHIAARYARLGETQDQFATRLGVSRPTVTNILNGKAKGIGLDLFIKAVRRLGLDPLCMIEREPEGAPGHQSKAPRLPTESWSKAAGQR